MSAHDITIHPTATVHPKARLDSGVWIGPGCVIGEKVSLGRNTRLESNVSIIGLTEVGADCRFAPFSSIGTEPQDIGYKGDETVVRIGDGNIFKEFITVNRGTVKGGGVTRIGDRNYFMAYSHIAHDCQVGNEVILTNNATLGGHVGRPGLRLPFGVQPVSTNSAGSEDMLSSADSRSSPRMSCPSRRWPA